MITLAFEKACLTTLEMDVVVSSVLSKFSDQHYTYNNCWKFHQSHHCNHMTITVERLYFKK